MPGPKAPFLGAVYYGAINPISVNTSAFFLARKKGLGPLPASQREHIDYAIHRAVNGYIDRCLLPQKPVQIPNTTTMIDKRVAVTLTERDTIVKRLVRSAKLTQFALNDKDNLFNMVADLEAIYRLLDFNTLIEVKKLLNIRDNEFFQMIAELYHHTHHKANEASIILLDKFATLLSIDVDESKRWADPSLYILISTLVPIWITATGRTPRRTSASNAEGGVYLFGEVVLDMLKQTGDLAFKHLRETLLIEYPNQDPSSRMPRMSIPTVLQIDKLVRRLQNRQVYATKGELL